MHSLEGRPVKMQFRPKVPVFVGHSLTLAEYNPYTKPLHYITSGPTNDIQTIDSASYVVRGTYAPQRAGKTKT